MSDPWLTPPEVAEQLKLSRVRAYEIVREQMDYVRIGRRVRVRQSEVDRWADERMVRTR